MVSRFTINKTSIISKGENCVHGIEDAASNDSYAGDGSPDLSRRNPP
jgi:hypothetical protein